MKILAFSIFILALTFVHGISSKSTKSKKLTRKNAKIHETKKIKNIESQKYASDVISRKKKGKKRKRRNKNGKGKNQRRKWSAKISGGDEVVPHAYPWVARLMMRDGGPGNY